MRLYILLAATAALLCTSVNAQHHEHSKQHEQKKAEIRAMKTAFITQRLNLTPEEAEKFWPIYNQFESKMEENREKRKSTRRLDQMEEMSDSEVEELVDLRIQIRQEELDIEKAFHLQVKQVLPIKKVAMLYKAEHDFRRELLHKMKGKGGPRGPGPGHGPGPMDD